MFFNINFSFPSASMHPIKNPEKNTNHENAGNEQGNHTFLKLEIKQRKGSDKHLFHQTKMKNDQLESSWLHNNF